jgi:hypothetical protein
MVDAIIEDRAQFSAVQVKLFGRDVGHFGYVAAGADRDISIHPFHLGKLIFLHEFELVFFAVQNYLAGDFGVANLVIRGAAAPVDVLYELFYKWFTMIAFAGNHHLIAAFYPAGIAYKHIGQLFYSLVHLSLLLAESEKYYTPNAAKIKDVD